MAFQARLTFLKINLRKFLKLIMSPMTLQRLLLHYPKQVNYTKIQNMITGLGKKSDDILKSAIMLENIGTHSFFKLSAEIYGTPRDTFRDGTTSPLDLALRFDEIIASFKKIRVS